MISGQQSEKRVKSASGGRTVRRILAKLSRVTSSGRFVPEIDGLRFVAIASVVLYHLVGYLDAKSDYHPAVWKAAARPTVAHIHEAHFGVQLFFAISGFVLALPFASHYLLGKPRVRLSAYFLRRVTRLEPPYILVMLVLFAGLVGYLGTSTSDALPHLLAGLGYSHNVIYGEVNPINPPAWSLEIEIQFYLLVPLLALVFAIPNKWMRRTVIVAIAAVAIAFQLLILDASGRWGLTIANFLQLFLAGFLLADVFLVDWREKPDHSWRWDVISILGWPILIYVWHTSPRLSAAALPALTFVLYVATFRGVLFNRFFTNLWITVIGGMCYSIYLLHYPIISFAGRVIQHLNVPAYPLASFLVDGVLLLGCVMLVSTLYFWAIEKPCMRRDWPRRFADWIHSHFGGSLRATRAEVLRAND